MRAVATKSSGAISAPEASSASAITATASVPGKRRRTARSPAQRSLLIADGTRVRDPRGGKRPGAGRPSTKERPSERHKRRPAVNSKHPQHVVIRVVPRVGGLRRKHMFRALRGALAVTFDNHEAFRICHISVQQTHVHLLVEANDRMALARGMQGFQIAAARRLNAAVDVVSTRLASRRAHHIQPTAVVMTETKALHRGSRQVFLDRYHATAITQPRQARHALAYVLNNWRRHGEHTHAGARSCRLDPFSSAAQFKGWEGVVDTATSVLVDESRESRLKTKPASTWLLRKGWQAHGKLRPTERPGPRPSTSQVVARA